MDALKIVSGGQTGVDRAALEWALANGFPHGGWCPKGRWAEDGIIHPQFLLQETTSNNPGLRTRQNVRDSDGTVIISKTAELTGGTAATATSAKKIGKPLLHLLSSMDVAKAAALLNAFVAQHKITVLNVAGPRKSEESGNAAFVYAVLSRAFKS
jgi:Circularly permutated YpsA SLOG family